MINRRLCFNQSWLIKIYLLMSLLVLLYSIKFTNKDILTLFFHPYAFLAFFVSIVVLTVEESTIIFMFKFSRTINNIILPLTLLDIYLFGKPVVLNELLYFIIIELLFFDKVIFRRKIYLILILLIEIYIENLFVNRTLVIKLISIPMVFLCFYNLRFLNYKSMKILVVTLTFTLMYYILFKFEDSYNFLVETLSLYVPKTNKNIDITDTRTFIFTEVFAQLDIKDILIGRGYLGTYYSNYFYMWDGENGDSPVRFTIEVGMLDVILKGGLILLIPFLLLIIKSIYTGFVKNSINTVSFRLSIFILVDALLLSVENCPSLNVHYLVLWLSVGITMYYNSYLTDIVSKKNKFIVA